MATLTAGAALREIGALFGRGIVAGEPDGLLLDRFLARRDAVAFEALVERHGPMVLAVCRGTLRDPGDVEDAFQATFLVLVRKAGSIRGRDALGPWLHRVARRVSVRANVEASRRRERERRAGEAREAASIRGPRDEIRAALHEEIDRLPERLRTPLVLCHLEDRTHAQAAVELRLGEATVRRRLSRARDLLRSRLGRRGIAPVGAVAAVLASESALAAMPASWASVAVRAAMAATFPGGIITPAASALSRRVARGIVLARARRYAATAAAALLACSVGGLVAA
jgi:RNA polymerase sigma factor (sigma-70 family)